MHSRNIKNKILIKRYIHTFLVVSNKYKIEEVNIETTDQNYIFYCIIYSHITLIYK